MWIDTELEKHMQEKLHGEFSNKQIGEKYYAQYITAREYLTSNIYPFIAVVEPQLTDHSDRHIENVLNNIWDLINDDLDRFNGVELYLLCLSTLFHDCGNINGREGHNKKISDICNDVINDNSTRLQEKRLVTMIVRAHCGQSRKNSSDTLMEVDETASLYSREVKVCEIASIIRFADELAEGPQRTSDYMRSKGKIDQASIIYHKYASITEVFIGKKDGRIALTYNIEIPIQDVDLETLLKFIYKRIVKLDTERRYCKYYATSLNKLKTTDVKINILIDGEDVIDLPKIQMEDKYILSNASIEDIIYHLYPELKIESILQKIGEYDHE